MNVIETVPFKLFPVNKAQNNAYSYHKSSPILTFEFNENFTRMIDPKSLRLCGKLRVYNQSSTGAVDQAPANRFDLASQGATQSEDEYICYLDDRVSVSSAISQVNVANLKGNLYEQFKSYNRAMASQMAVTASYKDLCSLYQMTFGSVPNNDCISRKCSGDIPFALRMMTGYLSNPEPISLASAGLSLSVNLTSTSNCVYGLNAEKFVYELRDVFLMGKYLVLEKPISSSRDELEYQSAYNYLSIVNSGNDHNNLNLNLQRCSFIYQNFLPSAWNNNFNYNGFSTPELLEQNAGNYDAKKLDRVTFNRGAVRFPYNYDLDFEVTNRDDGFQALRSRTFLNSIFAFSENRNCSISPDTEKITSMVEARSDFKKTPQSADQGLVNSWVFNANADFSRSGAVEKSARVYGIGLRLDSLHVGEAQDYSQASYNYSLKSQLDKTVNNTNVFVMAQTVVVSDSMGNLVASN